MKKILTFAFATLLIAAMSVMSVCALNLGEARSAITLGAPVTSSILELDPEDTHVFELKDSGTVTITISSPVPYFTVSVYDASGSKIWGEDAKCNGKIYTKDLELTSGSYYLDVLCYNKKYGSYNLLVSFKASGETFFENQNGSNNTIVDSVNNVLNVNNKYTGHLALNDYDDYFKIEPYIFKYLPSSRGF